MIPLTVEADMASAIAGRVPLYLDAALLWAFGAECGARREDGFEAHDVVMRLAEGPEGLPLARIEGAGSWWWAASACPPWGREARDHRHRRPPLELYADLTRATSVNVATGPDKALRIPVFRQIDQMRLRWTAVGDVERIRALLERVHAVGARTTQGYGEVRSWSVQPGGPALADYASDLRLRHLPSDLDVELHVPGARVSTRRLPLRPPYYGRGGPEWRDAPPCPPVDCWQVIELSEAPPWARRAA